MLTFAEVVLGHAGDTPCRRCAGTAAVSLRDASDVIEDVARVAAACAGSAGPNLALGGAEPFSHPDLETILHAAVAAGVRRIRLDTAAAGLDSDATARRVLQSGVRHLQVDLLGSNAASHDSRVGRQGAFAAALEGLARFARAAKALGVPVQASVRVPVCRHNLTDLPAIVTTATEAGISYVRLVLNDPTLDLWCAAPWLEAACDSGIVYTTWVEVEGLPFGPARGWELHLASLYHPVEGAKSPACSVCALNDVCGGAMHGALGSVTGRFAPPTDASAMAEAVGRGLDPAPGGSHD